QRGEGRPREGERRDVRAQQVAAEGAHARSRHYMRNSKSLQGMRRPTLVGLVALSLVIPQAYAQDTTAVRVRPPRPPGPPGFRATSSWTALPPPRLGALLPGGRLAPRTTPAAVARASPRRVGA